MAPATAAVIPTRRARSRWDPPTPWTSSTAASTTPHAVADADRLRCGATSQVLGPQAMARAPPRGPVGPPGAGPVVGPMPIDLDPPLGVVHAPEKQGPADGPSHTLGY